MLDSFTKEKKRKKDTNNMKKMSKEEKDIAMRINALQLQPALARLGRFDEMEKSRREQVGSCEH